MNNCCQSIKSYFSTAVPVPSQKMEGCSCQEQVEQLKQLETMLGADLLSRIHLALGSLAFLVEANKQLDQNNWRSQLADIANRVKEIKQKSEENSEAVAKETTWLLNDLITNLYRTALLFQDAKTQEPQEKEHIARLLQRQATLETLKKMVKQQDKPVSVGGVDVSYYPTWYTNHFGNK